MSNMLEEVKYLPELIAEQIPILDKQAKEVFDYRFITSIKDMIFTGCGDSYFAGVGAKHLIQRLCKIPARSLPAMEASRYDLFDYKSTFPYNPLVIATSVSGKVIRTVEAVEVAKTNNAMTLALVGDLSSPLAKSADKIIQCNIKKLPRSPGVASFRVSLLAMYLLGIHFAEVMGNISQKEAMKLRDELKKIPDIISTCINENNDKAKEFAQEMKEAKHFTIIGDGPNYASAQFSAAKIIEAVGLIAVAQNTEEWAHLQYFEDAYQKIPTIVITSNHRGYNRVLELLPPMKRIGRKIIAVAAKSCDQLRSEADTVFDVDHSLNDMFAPMVYPIAIELFSSHLADELQTGYYRENFEIYPRYANTIRDNNLLTREQIKSHG
jgi:glutamine---fructose-6-phosphate transaminase (isomerizing)